MENVILILILIAIVAAICVYLIRAKRKGAKCVGCPYAQQCNGTCCCTHTDDPATDN